MAAIAAAGGCGGEDGPETEPAGDNLVVALGDSVASGEGNPDSRNPVRWQSRRCHRSLRSGQAIAAAEVLGPETPARFVSVACSGAQIDTGMLKPYKGIEPRPGETVEPQVQSLARVAEGETIDAVMISIGANDVGFSKVVLVCQVLEPCENARFDPDLPLHRQLEARKPMRVSVPAAIDGLAERFRELDTALEKELPEQIPPERVLLVEYFDATSGFNGQLCAFGGISAHEAGWAQANLLRPLNEQLRSSADELGWTLVGEVDERFAGHGVCTREDRWVAQLDDSLFKAGSGFTGTLHPNAAGHAAIAAQIAPALAPLVAGGD